MSTISPFAGPAGAVQRVKPFGALASLCALGLASVLALAGCSSDKAADTSSAATVETSVAVDTVGADTTVVSVESVASAETVAEALPASSGSEAIESLAIETVASDTVASDTVAGDPGATPTSVDPQAAMEAAIVTGMSSQLGVTDPKQLACVGDSVKGADFAKPEGQGKILRAVLKCAPDAMAVSGAKSLRESNPSVTEKQSVCIVKATFGVLGGMADSELVAAMSSSKLSPEIVEATLAKAKGCGLSDADLRKALQQ